MPAVGTRRAFSFIFCGKGFSPRGEAQTVKKAHCRGEHCSPVPVRPVRSFPKRALLRQVGGRTMFAPTFSIGQSRCFLTYWASPLGEKLSAKRTDVGRVCPDSPLPGGSGKVCPHPSAGGAADTFPRGGRLPFYSSCSISSFFSGNSAAGSALKVRMPSFK